MTEYEEVKRGPSHEEWAAWRGGDVRDYTARPLVRAAFALEAQGHFSWDDVALLREIAEAVEYGVTRGKAEGISDPQAEAEAREQIAGLRSLADRLAVLLPPRDG